MKRTLTAVLASMLFFGLNLAWAGVRDDAIASVKVYKEVRPSTVVYTYEVSNKGTLPLIGFTVGFDYYSGTPELSGAHPVRVIAPAAWVSRVVSLEESDRYEVSWDIAGPPTAIAPGQTLAGFKIEMTQDDARFTSAHWSVIVDGPPSNASSTLQAVQGPPPAGDTVSPQISVTLSPDSIWPPNKKMADIVATVEVSDDQDPAPAVELVSVACNECEDPDADIAGAAVGTDDRALSVRAARTGKRKEGRVYTLTYAATDAAGNRASAQASVSVPHDVRKQEQ